MKHENNIGTMSLIKVFKELKNNKRALLIAAISTGALLLLFYYLFDLELMITMNSTAYVVTQVTLSVLVAVLFGLNLGFIVVQFHQRRILKMCSVSGAGTLVGTLALGCPVCGTGILASLLAVFGIEGGLALLPFEGIELKVLSIILLGVTLVWSAKRIRKN